MTPPCRYAKDDRVRLARPDNPAHPARGKAGVVLSTRYRDPSRGRPGVWWVEVLFRKATSEDWARYRTIDDRWDLLESELEPCASHKGAGA